MAGIQEVSSSKNALTDLSHVLLGGEDKFVIDQPARSFLEQAGVWMNVHGLMAVKTRVPTQANYSSSKGS